MEGFPAMQEVKTLQYQRVCPGQILFVHSWAVPKILCEDTFWEIDAVCVWSLGHKTVLKWKLKNLNLKLRNDF